jgi:hypothetical protein
MVGTLAVAVEALPELQQAAAPPFVARLSVVLAGGFSRWRRGRRQLRAVS